MKILARVKKAIISSRKFSDLRIALGCSGCIYFTQDYGKNGAWLTTLAAWPFFCKNLSISWPFLKHSQLSFVSFQGISCLTAKTGQSSLQEAWVLSQMSYNSISTSLCLIGMPARHFSSNLFMVCLYC